MGTIVDKLYGEYAAIVSMMDQYNAVSFRNTLNENFRKTLLLCAASHFEFRITSDVVAFCAEVAGGNPMVPTLVKNKAVSRQYHTWFQWEANNANAFFNMFGEDFRAHMMGVVRLDPNMARSISSFLEIGRERNRLVHQDYGSFFLEKTAEEIFGLYVSAMVFVDFVPMALRGYSMKLQQQAQPV
ncbi:HEPN domain-containing protein [Bradyrhizobium oligotrophicum S58]